MNQYCSTRSKPKFTSWFSVERHRCGSTQDKPLSFYSLTLQRIFFSTWPHPTLLDVFCSPFEILCSVILLYSPQWKRAALGEKRISEEFWSEIKKENAWEREQIPVKQILLLPWCMNVLTITRALHVFLQRPGLNAAKEGHGTWQCSEKAMQIWILEMDTGPLMFHKAVSVHINRSAHKILKIYLFIEIFNMLALFRLQETQRFFFQPAIN